MNRREVLKYLGILGAGLVLGKLSQESASNDTRKMLPLYDLVAEKLLPELDRLKHLSPELGFNYEVFVRENSIDIQTNIPGLDPFGSGKDGYSMELPLTIQAVLNGKDELYLFATNGEIERRGVEDILEFVAAEAKRTMSVRGLGEPKAPSKPTAALKRNHKPVICRFNV